MIWADLPLGRAVRLTGASPAAIALTLVPPPEDAPAVVVYRPTSAASVVSVVEAALDELETVAIRLFPAWLPGAEGITGPAGAGVAAVRAVARELSQPREHCGPFLADLAERALRRHRPRPGRFAREVRAAGLARVVACAYGRTTSALVVQIPDGLDTAGQQALAGACEWLAHWGRLGVWLAGPELPAVDRLMTMVVRLPEAVERLDRETPRTGEQPVLPTVLYPAIAGRPHPGSDVECAVEAALASLPWAVGRAWNQTYDPHPLDEPYRLDLLWRAEQVVVEFDGPEHRERLRYASDRRRDNRLQHAGYTVFRFTNAQVATDLAAVLEQIRIHLQSRRTTEGHHHAQQR
jgi:hypothetical protein